MEKKEVFNGLIHALLIFIVLYVGCVTLPDVEKIQIQNPQTVTIKEKIIESHSFVGMEKTEYIFKVGDSKIKRVYVNESDYMSCRVGDEYEYQWRYIL